MDDKKEPTANVPGRVPPMLDPFYAKQIIGMERCGRLLGRQNPSASRTLRLSTQRSEALFDVALPVEIMWFHAHQKCPEDCEAESPEAQRYTGLAQGGEWSEASGHKQVSN
jgi:hypothetical protein